MAATRVKAGCDARGAAAVAAAPSKGQLLRVDLYAALPPPPPRTEFDAWPARRSLNEVFFAAARRKRSPRQQLTRQQHQPPPPPPPPSVGRAGERFAEQASATKLTKYTWKNYAQNSWWLGQFPDMVYKSSLCQPRNGSVAMLPSLRSTSTGGMGRAGAGYVSAEKRAAAAARLPVGGGGGGRTPYRASELYIRSLASTRPLGAARGRLAAASEPSLQAAASPAAVAFFVGSHLGSAAAAPLARPLPRESARSRRSHASSTHSHEDRCPTPKTYKSVASYRRIVESSSTAAVRRPTAPLHCTRQTSAVSGALGEGEDVLINAVEFLNTPVETNLPKWALEERQRDDGAVTPCSSVPHDGGDSASQENDTFTLAVSIRSKAGGGV